MNALAGGGSFVSLPALMAVGVPSVQANASSTVALMPGTLASAFAYRAGLRAVAGVALRWLLLASLTGGLIGALILLATPVGSFNLALPWLLLFATLVLAFGPKLGERLRRHRRIRPATVLIAQFLLGVYGGYFGGAVGLMMLALWSLLEGRDLKSLNAPRTLLVTAANASAMLAFVAARAVYWPETLVMLVAAVAGGYAGAELGRRAPAKVIRAGTIAVTSSITVAFFVRSYAF
jgi:uncharacterized membrane protein YfcA